MGKKVPPSTASDRRLSVRHLKESVKFNKAHAKDHEKAAKKAQKLMKSKYTRSGVGT